MAKYIMQNMPDIRGVGQRIKYPKMQIVGQCSHRDLVADIAERTSFARGDVEGMLVALSEALARRMAYGYSVKVEGLGTFRAKLGLRPGAEREGEGQAATRRNATSIEVAGVLYTADKDLVQRTDRACSLEREPAQSYTPLREGRAERLTLLKTYLREHKLINIPAYAHITGLSLTSAGKELRQLCQAGELDSLGAGSHRTYTLSEMKGVGE